MSRVLALALKDLRLLPRNRSALFFTFVWPVIVTVLFGFAFGGGARGQSKPRVALVDEDGTAQSRAFAERLGADFELEALPRIDAETAVRRGQRSAYVVLPPGFGEATERMFYGAPRQVEVGIDPSRQAEAGMIEGLLMKHAAKDMQTIFGDPGASARMVDRALADLDREPAGDKGQVRHFLGELKSFVGDPSRQTGQGGGPNWEPLHVLTKDVALDRLGPENAFDITFPQGVVWGLIGCVMSFGLSLVTERTRGTLVRLRMAPLTRAQILGGKALACFLSMIVVELLLLGVALVLGVRVSSAPLLALAGLAAAACFVGIMMLIASLGTTEQAVSGAAWAILMPLSVFGGAMVPEFVLPAWMRTVGMASPIRWARVAIEGAVWRQFSVGEMLVPCAILVGVGVACFALGTRGLKDES